MTGLDAEDSTEYKNAVREMFFARGTYRFGLILLHF